MIHSEHLRKADESYEIRHDGNGNAIHVFIKDGYAIIFPSLWDLILYEYIGESVERFYMDEDELSKMYDDESYNYYELKAKYSDSEPSPTPYKKGGMTNRKRLSTNLYANGGQTKQYYIVKFGFEGDDGYQIGKSKPIYASSEDEAALTLKDQFESFEGMDCDIISVTKQMAYGGGVDADEELIQKAINKLKTLKFIYSVSGTQYEYEAEAKTMVDGIEVKFKYLGGVDEAAYDTGGSGKYAIEEIYVDGIEYKGKLDFLNKEQKKALKKIYFELSEMYDDYAD